MSQHYNYLYECSNRLLNAVLSTLSPDKTHFCISNPRWEEIVKSNPPKNYYDGEKFEAIVRPMLLAVPHLSTENQISDIFRTQLSYHLTPTSPGYLYTNDPRANYSQLTVETAILCLILSETKFLTLLSTTEKSNIFNWIMRFPFAKVHPNNWHWFRLFINIFLENNNLPFSTLAVKESIQELDKLYIGTGWYSDAGKLDLYNAWGHAFWCIFYLKYAKDPTHKEKFTERLNQFLSSYSGLFSLDGRSPKWGRSVIYRFAASAPFAVAFNLPNIDFNPGFARHIVVNNVKRFLEIPAVTDKNGLLTLGFRCENFELVDNYSNAASPYFSAITFLCLLLPLENKFWSSEESTGFWQTGILPTLPKQMTIKATDDNNIIFECDQDYRNFKGVGIKWRYRTPIVTKW